MLLFEISNNIINYKNDVTKKFKVSEKKKPVAEMKE